MNEKIDLTKILRNCPKGTRFYSSIFGEETYLFGIDHYEGNPRPIAIYGELGEVKKFYLSSKGHPFANGCGECVLFPSKDQRDWSKFAAPWLKKEKFDPKTLKPRNKVRFYVTRDFLGGNTLHLWLGKPIKYEEKWTATLKSAQCIGSDLCLLSFNLNPDDFADMKAGEIREVFINLDN